MFDAAKYTVGWIFALPVESAAALALLDEKYGEIPEVGENDNNSYFLGRICHHNFVIAGLPDGEYGTTSAASVANSMLHSFPNVRIGLMVGIGGGAPTENNDIRLGDVIVSSRNGAASGVFQYDFGKVLQDKDAPFAHTGLLNQPPVILRTAVATLKATHMLEGHGLHRLIEQALKKRPRLNDSHSRPSPDDDKCYRSTFVHPDASRTCEEVCGIGTENIIEPKPARKEPGEPEIHYGQIGSANSLMKDATVRDRLAKEHNILCFEMEAAGLMNHFPCLVIRGICDYSDSHKNKKWQGYASMAAASYAKEVLSMIPKSKVEYESRLADDAIPGQVGGQHHASGEDEIIKYLDALKTDVNYDLQKDRNTVCAPGTGEWFFHHPEYEAFEKVKGSQLLFVTAEAGDGKSTTMRTLVDKLQASPEPPLVAYFFFKDDDDSLRSYDGALSTLTYQLLGNALRHNTKVLWKIILDIAAEVDHGVVCILDAVDECAALDRKQLVADLAEIFNSESQIPSISRLKFVVTSRPYEDRDHPYSDLFEGAGSIRVLAGENAQVSSDIRNVIRFKAEELAQKRQLSRDIQDLLISRLWDQNLKTRSFLAIRMAFELMDSDHRM
ncbi:hypothetical protein NW766_012696 [Fusarium irregulare]|uniref:NACHT domain-containing protein n=1 Tax=Fusarium irregulare TaxID=2494466 RepID=A0A9W8U3R7_9HYPO|nr:hypothetical protein NW766_012696 [Fusarium irregulare]